MTKMITCVIDSVRVSLTNQQRVVVLKERDSDHYLPIWIGLYEAEAITIALQHIEVARPQTHDLLQSSIKILEGQLLYVEITALRDDVFYANLVVEQNNIKKYIDCRPSDALALAARAGVEIMVEEEVLNTAGIRPEEDISSSSIEEYEKVEVEDEDLSIFEDFLGKLDNKPDDEEKSQDDDEGSVSPTV